MADTKTTGLTELSAAPADDDLVTIVDISDTTMSAAGTNKKITRANLVAGLSSGGTNNPVWGFSTVFESISSRFISTVGTNGTTTSTTSGASISATSDIGSNAKLEMTISNGFSDGAGLTTLFSTVTRSTSAGFTNGEWCNWASNGTTVAAAGITYTNQHYGWRCIVASGTASLKATNANGSSETSTEISTSQSFNNRLTLVREGTTDIKFYSGADTVTLSATHTTNLPTEGNVDRLVAAVSNRNNADDGTLNVGFWEFRTDNTT